VIEAVPENTELKAGIFAQLDTLAPADAVLASNTSSLSITALQAATTRPGRVIGLHFFNPVHINALVEVVRGQRTDERVVERCLDFVRDLGKDPIVVNDSPGFATSRLGVLLGLEAIRMVEQGVASADDIDKAMTLGYRHPMGPLRLTDLVGLDIRLAIAKYLHEKLGSEAFRPPRLLEDMVAQGKLGKKSGEGFYAWPADG
jgi:3-hydroxybutyryl-CoA dehydrogenase